MAEAGRVIAGSARGVRLLAPGAGTRPIADRVKQTLFAILEPELPGALVVDLCAGSGAGGIEALSRGAARAIFVERDEGAVRTIADNLRRAGLADRATVTRMEALRWLASEGDVIRADLVLVDPPYAETALFLAILDRLGRGAAVRAGGRVVAKHFWRDAPPAEIGLLRSERTRRFGETALTFYRVSGAGGDPSGGEEADVEVAG